MKKRPTKRRRRNVPEAPMSLEDAAIALRRASLDAAQAADLEETSTAYAAWVRADVAFKLAVDRRISEREDEAELAERIRAWEEERERLERERPRLEDVRFDRGRR